MSFVAFVVKGVFPMSTATSTPARISGGSFLLDSRTPEEVFTPEDFSEQHLLIVQTAEEFALKEILPNIEKIIIDGKISDRMLPYLPLDRLKPKPSTAAEGQNP